MVDHEGRASLGLGCLMAVIVALALGAALGSQLGWLTLGVIDRVQV